MTAWRRFTERSVLGLLLLIAFGLLLLLVRAEWRPLHALDHAVAASLNAAVSGHESLVAALRGVSVLGGPPVTPLLAAVVAAGLLLRRQVRLALYLAVTGLGALVLDPTLKTLVGRLRPVVDVPIASAPGNSFPSGHALGTVVAYGAVLLIFMPLLRPVWRRVAVASWAALVVLVGFTRVALGVHFVSDVLGGWLLGLAWLGITAHAFRPGSLTGGLDPAAVPALRPAPGEHDVLPHRWAGVAKILTGWVLVLGALYAAGRLAGGAPSRIDREVPAWFAARRTPALDAWSEVWSHAGGTPAILGVSLVAAPLMVAAWRRWRPVLFLALVMLGELTLFLAASAAVGRDRPPVPHLDGGLATSSFPSGHVAAALCLWVTIALLVLPRVRGWWRWIPVAAAVVVPAGVAVSRLYRGMHHPSDLLGSLLLTVLWIGLLYLIVRPHAGTADRGAAGSAGADVPVTGGAGLAGGAHLSGEAPAPRQAGPAASPQTAGSAGAAESGETRLPGAAESGEPGLPGATESSGTKFPGATESSGTGLPGATASPGVAGHGRDPGQAVDRFPIRRG